MTKNNKNVKNVKHEISARARSAMEQAYANIRLEGLTVSEETQKLIEENLRDGTKDGNFDTDSIRKQILGRDS